MRITNLIETKKYTFMASNFLLLPIILLSGCRSETGIYYTDYLEEDSDIGDSLDSNVPYDGDTVDGDGINEHDSDTQDEPETITIQISTLTTEAQFFTYETLTVPPKTVRFFAVLGEDNAPHVALDACEVCFQSRLGFSQNGNLMHCNNCGNEYPIVGLGTKNTQGGCWPAYLPVTITSEEIIIQKADLELGAQFFD